MWAGYNANAVLDEVQEPLTAAGFVETLPTTYRLECVQAAW